MSNLMKSVGKFENCISLGWYCGTASSMAKYGLRSGSGPFDWFFSDYSAVIRQIDDDFVDFMTRENLIADKDNPRKFMDSKYGFEVCHDVKNNLDADYPNLYKKYQRRVERFLEMVKQPTLFFRAVRSQEELTYIQENNDYINGVLRKSNSKNCVVYLLLDSMVGILPEDINAFCLNRTEYQHLALDLGNMFDNNPALLDFCTGLLDEKTLLRNKLFYEDSNAACAAMVDQSIVDNDRCVAEALDAYFGSEQQGGIYLWGMGYHGQRLYEYCREHDICIAGIIDQYADKKELCGTPVLKPEDLQDGICIFISIADSKTVDEIMRQLCAVGHVKCGSYRDLIGLL